MQVSSAQSTAVEPIRLVVAETMERMIRAGESFTALDVSNHLKQRGFGVRHGEVAPVVRDLFAHGALTAVGYDRELIEVNTEGGAKITEAFLYLPQTALPSDYARRVQDALPPVPPDAARDLTAYVPSFYPAALLQTASGRRRRSGGVRGKVRRDGALPIARQWVREAGWQTGDVLVLSATTNDGGDATLRLTIAPAGGTEQEQEYGLLVRVWAGERVRIARTKLRGATPFGNDVARLSLAVENGCLRIERIDAGSLSVP